MGEDCRGREMGRAEGLRHQYGFEARGRHRPIPRTLGSGKSIQGQQRESGDAPFHFTERRIEAHICICFVAYKVYKELERVIRHAGIAMSVDKVLDIAKTIITIDVRTDGVRGVSKRTLFLTEEQKAIKQLFEMDTTKVIRVTHRRSQGCKDTYFLDKRTKET